MVVKRFILVIASAVISLLVQTNPVVPMNTLEWVVPTILYGSGISVIITQVG